MWCMSSTRQRLLIRLHNPQYLTSTGVVAVAYKVLLSPADFRDCIHSTGAYSPYVKSFSLARFGRIAVLLAFEPITGSPRTAGGILTGAFCLDTILKTECVPWYAVTCSHQNASQDARQPSCISDAHMTWVRTMDPKDAPPWCSVCISSLLSLHTHSRNSGGPEISACGEGVLRIMEHEVCLKMTAVLMNNSLSRQELSGAGPLFQIVSVCHSHNNRPCVIRWSLMT